MFHEYALILSLQVNNLFTDLCSPRHFPPKLSFLGSIYYVSYSYYKDRPPRTLFGRPRQVCFPHNGKTFRSFSTQWKNLFHTVENSDFRLFSGVLGCSLGAVERSTRRPLSIVERDRPRGREKWCPTKWAAPSTAPPRVRCRARPFFWPRGRGFLALSGAKGALRVERCPTQGAVNTS